MNKQELNLAVAQELYPNELAYRCLDDGTVEVDGTYNIGITCIALVDITTNDTQLNYYVEFKKIDIYYIRHHKIWSADIETDTNLCSYKGRDKSRKAAMLKCICAIHGIDYE